MERVSKEPRSARPKEKAEAVEAVLAGESVAAVASQRRLDPALVTKWTEAYTRAGRRAIRFTMDPGEKPRSLDDLATSAQRAFPQELLCGARTAIAYFCAQTYGRNDVTYLATAGLPDVELVDLAEEKLTTMAELYPKQWRTSCTDAFGHAGAARRAGRAVDIVVTDPFSTLVSSVVIDHFHDFWALTRLRWFALFTHDTFSELGVPPETDAVSDALIQLQGVDLRVDAVVKRSSHLGGTYWTVIIRPDAPPL